MEPAEGRSDSVSLVGAEPVAQPAAPARAPRRAKANSAGNGTANLGFEAKLLAGVGDYEDANPEDPDEYKAENVCWVPGEARCSQLQANAGQATIELTAASEGEQTHRSVEMLEADLEKISSTYHHWRGTNGAGTYEDIPGFCKSATTTEIAAHGHVLTPGR